MPLYDYACANCGHRFEVIHGVTAEGPSTCPNCGGGPVRKAITAPAIHFKGSGWAKKERRASTAAASATGSSDAKTEDGAAAATKTDASSSKESTASKDSASKDGASKKPAATSNSGSAD